MTTVLIIDDEEQMRKVLSMALERSGYDTICAADGDEGIRLFKEKGADLIITDLIMPEKEGIETIMELKRECPDVKIIAMSGGGKNDPLNYLPLAKSLGARSTLSKPFKIEELLKTVKDELDS